MNNTKSILLMAAITSLLIMGTAITPMQSYAGEHKKTGDFKDSIKASTEVDKKSASQKLDQDNFCYRSDDCQQANQGQQLVGKDNEAKGFNDQSLNVQQAATATPTTTPTPGNGTTPTPLTCQECFSTILTPAQIATLSAAAGRDFVAFGCDRGPSDSLDESSFIENLQVVAGIDLITANALVTCLKAAGITFTP